MQFQGKLMNHTSSGPNIGPFGLNSGRQKFFCFFCFLKICLRQSLDIIVSYDHVQYQKKLTIQFWENLVMDGRTDGQTVTVIS